VLHDGELTASKSTLAYGSMNAASCRVLSIALM
jgi:hypothetical protein